MTNFLKYISTFVSLDRQKIQLCLDYKERPDESACLKINLNFENGADHRSWYGRSNCGVAVIWSFTKF